MLRILFSLWCVKNIFLAARPGAECGSSSASAVFVSTVQPGADRSSSYASGLIFFNHVAWGLMRF